jgi:Raf kinase inhibitor-like YbhB/YbcL family protein
MRPPLPYDFLPRVPSFVLASDDIAHDELMSMAHVYDGFGLDGQNLSPHLRWFGFPPETGSFAVTCLDVDAPTGSGFWHWVLFDIPAGVTELPRGSGSVGAESVPEGAVHARNDYGDKAYGGAAPPKGDDPHRYVFAVHAVDRPTLGLHTDASAATVGYNLAQHGVARTLLVPTFGH